MKADLFQHAPYGVVGEDILPFGLEVGLSGQVAQLVDGRKLALNASEEVLLKGNTGKRLDFRRVLELVEHLLHSLLQLGNHRSASGEEYMACFMGAGSSPTLSSTLLKALP